MPARILIGGDLVPTKSNAVIFQNGDAEKLVGKTLNKKLHDADFTVFNLEVPLTDITSPITKCGPNLIASTDSIRGLQAINPHFFGLANNHILDQGAQGLKSTMKTLWENHLAFAGAGDNLSAAAKPFVKEIRGIKFGIYCCAEHEFTIAGENTPGANPFDPLESLDHVAILKKQVDYVIVLYHGGKEHYRYPSPHLQKVCRKLVDKGADLVVCQHSHCIGAAEKWKDGTIIYGQGNFLFDLNDSEYWQTSLLIELELEKLEKSVKAKIRYIPLKKQHEKVRIAKGGDAENILKEFQNRSGEIMNSGKVQEHYQKFADTMLAGYLMTISGRKNILFRILNKLSGHRLNSLCISWKYNKEILAAVRNYAECEAHRELFLQGINDWLTSGRD